MQGNLGITYKSSGDTDTAFTINEIPLAGENFYLFWHNIMSLLQT